MLFSTSIFCSWVVLRDSQFTIILIRLISGLGATP